MELEMNCEIVHIRIKMVPDCRHENLKRQLVT